MGYETWVPTEYPGYEVSDQGRVRSPNKVLSQQIVGGYPSVKVTGGKRVFIHRLMGKAFIPGEAPGLVVRHYDDVPTHNVVANLLWGTKSQNTLDRVRNGNHHEANKTHCKSGHEFTPENTRHLPRGERVCKTCDRQRTLNYRERRAA